MKPTLLAFNHNLFQVNKTIPEFLVSDWNEAYVWRDFLGIPSRPGVGSLNGL